MTQMMDQRINCAVYVVALRESKDITWGKENIIWPQQCIYI